MSTAINLTLLLIGEGYKARAHYQVWWALRNRALPKYLAAMNDDAYVFFFHLANSGHYTLFLLSLSKIFDRDNRVAGIKELKRALRAEGKTNIANEIARMLKPHEKNVRSVMGIRNRSVVHNEYAVSIEKVYQMNGVTPNQLRDLIDATCQAINLAARDLGISARIFDNDSTERATLKMLEVLAMGAKAKRAQAASGVAE
jgi:hypothetical protein